MAAFAAKEVLDEAQQVVVERELGRATRAWATDGEQTRLGERPDGLQPLLEDFKACPAPCPAPLEDVDELPVLISRESELAGQVRVLGGLDREPRLGVKLEVRRHPMLAIQPAPE